MKPTALFLLPSLLLPLLPAEHARFAVPARVQRAEAPASRPAAALPLSGVERSALLRAEHSSATELADLRGGDLSNSDLTTILLVLGIVALLVIIL